MILEGTPEFNRNHRLLNGAGLNPYIDRPIPSQQPLNIPRQSYEEHDWTEQEAGIAFTEAFLEGLEYHPAPQIIPDNRIGFDSEGNFHTVEHFTEYGHDDR